MENNVRGDAKRIAFVWWEGYLGIEPDLINAIHMLSEAGYEVDFITRFPAHQFAEAPSVGSNVRIIRFPFSYSRSTKQTGLRYLVNYSLSSFTKRVLVPVKRTLWDPPWLILELSAFTLFAFEVSRNRYYDCLIGVDPRGLIAASALGLIRRIPVFYWSLELTFLKEAPHLGDRLLKHFERLCHRRAYLTIIQSWERAYSLAKENRIVLEESKLAIVPVCPLGAAPSGSGDYFRQRFNLPSSRRLILSAGQISEWALSLELAETASRWPDEWSLILHERIKRYPTEPYLEEIRKAAKGRILLSLDPVPYDQLDFLISSAHIGIVLYARNIGMNHSLMDGASGKLAQYLRCGLPVICTNLPGLQRVVSQYRCGLIIEDLKDMESAITEIFADYEHYRANALRCYEEVFEFGSHFRRVIMEIEALSR